MLILFLPSPPLSLCCVVPFVSDNTRMPFFKRKSPNSNSTANPEGNSNSHHSANSFARSVEHLIPAFADGRSIQQQQSQPPPPHNPSSYEELGHFSPDPRFTSPEGSGAQRQLQPGPSSLHRSQSQRQPHQLQQRDRPTVSVVAPEQEQSQSQTQPRQKRGLFVRPSSGILDRSSSVSIKGKTISHPISQPASPQVPSLSTSDEHVAHYPQDHSPATHSYEPRSTSLAYQQQLQHLRQPSLEQNERSPQSQYPSQQFPAPIDQPYPRPLVRSNTDPNLLGNSSQPSFVESTDEPSYPYEDHRGQPHRSQQDLVLNARPPSWQSYEPLSPIHSRTHPDAMQQASVQAPPPPPSSNDQPSGSSSRRGSATTHNMPDQPGRQTPNSTRQREDPGDIDVRALLQKHEELRMFNGPSPTSSFSLVLFFYCWFQQFQLFG